MHNFETKKVMILPARTVPIFLCTGFLLLQKMDRGSSSSRHQRPKSSSGIGHRHLSSFTSQHTTEYEDPARHAPEEYLNKYGLSAYFKDVMTLVLENRPHDPIDFITEYYRNCAQGSSYLHRSYRYIRLTERNNDVFMDNLYMSYKSLSRRKGSIGATGEEMSKLLTLLCHDFPHDVSSNILRRLGRRPADVVSFEEFALATKACLLYEEFFEIAEEVFEFASISCGPTDADDENEDKTNIAVTPNRNDFIKNNKFRDLISYNATPYNVSVENRWYQMQQILNTPEITGTFDIHSSYDGNVNDINSNSNESFSVQNKNDDSNVEEHANVEKKTPLIPNGSRLNKRVNAKKFVNLLKDIILKMSIMENNLHASNNIDVNSSIPSSPMSPLSASLMFPSLKILEKKVSSAASSHPLGNITLQEFARCVFEMTKRDTQSTVTNVTTGAKEVKS